MKFFIRLIQKPKLQLRWKLLSSFLVATTLLTIVQILPILNLGQTTNTLDDLNASIKREVLMDQINFSQTELLNTALEAIFTRKAARAVEFDIAVGNLNKAIANFSPQPWQQESYKSLNTELQSLSSQLSTLVSETNSNSTSISVQQSIESWNQVNPKQLDRIHSLINDLIQKEKYNSTLAYQQSITQANNVILWICILSGLGVVIALILALLMTSAIVQPIQQLRYCLSGLAKGDLTNRTNIINQDELGELGQTFNQTLESLSGLVEELYRQSQKVNSATSELTYQANSQVAGSEQQAQAILETTTAMNELNYSTVTIMQQATMVNNSVSGCVQEAEHVNQVVEAMDTAQNRGRQIIARAISGLRVLKEQVSLINEQQQVLVNQSEVMQQVINTLDNIAQNTHLLALNAAIEAAGAGEQGERFRVVAKEVRELSNRSTKYTYEIRKALSSVAASVEQVNTLGKQCLQEAEHAVHDSSNADLVLVELANLGQQVKLAANSILEKVMQSAILAEDIGVSISQQQSISTQTVEKMLSINAITSQNLNSIKQGEVATFELDRTAQALTKSANSFKLIMINT